MKKKDFENLQSEFLPTDKHVSTKVLKARKKSARAKKKILKKNQKLKVSRTSLFLPDNKIVDKKIRKFVKQNDSHLKQRKEKRHMVFKIAALCAATALGGYLVGNTIQAGMTNKLPTAKDPHTPENVIDPNDNDIEFDDEGQIVLDKMTEEEKAILSDSLQSLILTDANSRLLSDTKIEKISKILSISLFPCNLCEENDASDEEFATADEENELPDDENAETSGTSGEVNETADNENEFSGDENGSNGDENGANGDDNVATDEENGSTGGESEPPLDKYCLSILFDDGQKTYALNYLTAKDFESDSEFSVNVLVDFINFLQYDCALDSCTTMNETAEALKKALKNSTFVGEAYYGYSEEGEERFCIPVYQKDGAGKVYFARASLFGGLIEEEDPSKFLLEELSKSQTDATGKENGASGLAEETSQNGETSQEDPTTSQEAKKVFSEMPFVESENLQNVFKIVDENLQFEANQAETSANQNNTAEEEQDEIKIKQNETVTKQNETAANRNNSTDNHQNNFSFAGNQVETAAKQHTFSENQNNATSDASLDWTK